MNIKNFEKFVEKKILDRGQDYYEQELVGDVEHIAQNEFRAIVQGSEEYSVYLRLDRDLNITSHSCDCPYDWGDVCKHEVAVMYFVRDCEMYKTPIDGSAFQKLRHQLDKTQKDNLVALLMDISKTDRNFREALEEVLSD